MHRFVFAAALCGAAAMVLLPAPPAAAITAKQKMETCRFGADEQKLTSKERAIFLRKCMSNRNDPRGPAAPSASPGPDVPYR